MGCTIPGCGSSGHNRRTHDKHVPPGEPLDPTRFLVGERGPSSVVGKEEDHGPDAGQSVVQAATSGDQNPITADDIRAIPGVDHECEPAPDQVWFCRYCGDDLREDGPLPADIVPLPVPPWRTVLGPDEPIRISLPGCYELTSEQYHSFDVTGDWFSNSDAKKLLQTCPAQFDYDRRNGVKKISDAFDFGHVAHAVVLGDGERYEVFEPKRIDRRTKEGQAQQKAVDEARAAGRTPIYGDQFALIEAMAEAIKADPIPHELLTQPGRPEVCLFWHEQIKVTDPHNSLYGQTVQVKRRAMIDHLPDLTEDGKTVRIVDYKTADEVKPDDSLRKKVYDYGYHRQSATYEAAVECLFGRSADVVFLLQSKKPPHLIVPVEMDTPAVRVAVAENNQAMALWAECVATGEWPGYVSGIALSGVPAWVERQFEEVTVIN
jgi:hypothetical protein